MSAISPRPNHTITFFVISSRQAQSDFGSLDRTSAVCKGCVATSNHVIAATHIRASASHVVQGPTWLNVGTRTVDQVAKCAQTSCKHHTA